MTTKNKCVIYCRVSADRQAKEGESLEVQENICRDIAKQKGLKIIKVFSEPFSGRKENRPAFDEMFEFIKESKDIGFLIFRTLDRFTRGGSFSYEKTTSVRLKSSSLHYLNLH